MILARLVTPSDYGVISLILIFIQVATVFIQSGFNTALIQKKDADDLDFSSIFYLSVLVAGICYITLFFLAPVIAGFYNQNILKSVIRVLALTLFFGAVNSVQNAVVSRTMQFKRFFYSSLSSILGSGVIGIYLAYNGLGVWALVWQQLINNALICLILWFTVKWRPKLLFSFMRVRHLFSFGWKLLCSALLDTIFRNIYGLVIGKIYSSGQLGFFNRGQQFPQVIATNLDGSIQSVMLPALSAHSDDTVTIKRMARRSISASSFLLMPCMFGLAAVAQSLISLLLTDKWLECVPFLRLACISCALYPIHTANLTAINAVGRSDIFLKLEIIKKIIATITLLLTIPLGIMAMAIGQVATGFISTFVNAYPNKRLLDYSYIEQIADIFPSFILSLIMSCCVFCIGFIHLPVVVIFILQIISGVFIYVMGAKILKFEIYQYIKETARRYFKKQSC